MARASETRWAVVSMTLVAVVIILYGYYHMVTNYGHHVVSLQQQLYTSVVHPAYVPQLQIAVVVPNYHNTDLLLINLALLRSRATYKSIPLFVVTMEDDQEERDDVRAAVGDLATVLDLPQPGEFGGSALPGLFRKIGRMMMSELSLIDVVVVADTDAFVLSNGWDETVEKLFIEDPQLSLAAINPRTGVFQNQPEWNWMCLLRERWVPIMSNPPDNFGVGKLHDWGHWFGNTASDRGNSVKLWSKGSAPFPGRAAHIVGDEAHPRWVLHFFYGTRPIAEPGFQELGEMKAVLTPAERDLVLRWAQQPVVGDFASFRESESRS